MDNSFVDTPNQPLMNDPFVLMAQSAPSYALNNLTKSAVRMDCVGSAMANCGHGDESTQSMNNITRDDGCRLVLGLGPTPDFYSTDYPPTGVYKSKESQTLSGQSFSFTDPGVLRLGLQTDGAETIQHLQTQNETVHSFAVVDEASTSAAVRSMGGYMPSLLFAPCSNSSAANETELQSRDSLNSTHYNSNNTQHIQHLQLSPEPSATTETSFGVSSDVVTGATTSEQRSHPRHPKKCRFKGCSKGGRGSSGLCIAHGGGQRCHKPGCHKGAESSTAYCKAHGGGRRCEELGCTKSAEGKTDYCIAHGGGKRCMFEGGGVCPKSVHGGTEFCVAHGGGKRCAAPGCTKSARGRTDCCVKHGGGKRCRIDNCGKSAQGSTDFCKAHGGGKRCTWGSGCEKFARGKSGLCAAHGTLVARQQEHGMVKSGGSMIGPGLFSGIVASSTTAASSMTNEHSSSGISTASDSDGTVRSQAMIPPQLLVPRSMMPSSSSEPTVRGGREAGCAVPEGRVHGGGLLSLLGGSFRNANIDKL
ncbi:unnamed protein product [Triticum turgidum subsp. durum]|uniref:WRKY19-like zinc finger domain-containing protein n=1 Tax=Triticum turgidum subsp. durum TaxID=4567 RepID=A0A9R1RNZ7_TRITD|nr:unnamed protein product [Triticum turgidum subsp. durum]